jgi:hypothetical protein
VIKPPCTAVSNCHMTQPSTTKSSQTVIIKRRRRSRLAWRYHSLTSIHVQLDCLLMNITFLKQKNTIRTHHQPAASSRRCDEIDYEDDVVDESSVLVVTVQPRRLFQAFPSRPRKSSTGHQVRFSSRQPETRWTRRGPVACDPCVVDAGPITDDNND